jgi:hypothetical protein
MMASSEDSTMAARRLSASAVSEGERLFGSKKGRGILRCGSVGAPESRRTRRLESAHTERNVIGITLRRD